VEAPFKKTLFAQVVEQDVEHALSLDCERGADGFADFLHFLDEAVVGVHDFLVFLVKGFGREDEVLTRQVFEVGADEDEGHLQFLLDVVRVVFSAGECVFDGGVDREHHVLEQLVRVQHCGGLDVVLDDVLENSAQDVVALFRVQCVFGGAQFEVTAFVQEFAATTAKYMRSADVLVYTLKGRQHFLDLVVAFLEKQRLDAFVAADDFGVAVFAD